MMKVEDYGVRAQRGGLVEKKESIKKVFVF